MIKNVRIVSLSRGLLGMPFIDHEEKIGLKRLEEMGVHVTFGEHARKGMDYVSAHPEDRAKDLLDAFQDDSVDCILCAIGGDDTYRLLPYLFDRNELQEKVTKKIFLGFSDTTANHFMLNKVGLPTFYGQSFIADICNIGPTMLPYSEKYLKELLETGTISEIRPADVWYESRSDFSPASVGTKQKEIKNQGFELLQGPPKFSGKIFGGCIDVIYDMFFSERYEDTAALCEKYRLFPDNEYWKGKILLLETSEEKMPPEKYEKIIRKLKETGIFEVLNGMLIGKPENEAYFTEYKEILKRVIANPDFPIVTNLNIGHAEPRCIIPFNVEAVVDQENQVIRFQTK